MSLIGSIIVFVLVIAGLIFISVRGKNNVSENTAPTKEEIGQDVNTENKNMDTNGVKITVLKEGSGEVAKTGDRVSVNYTGSLLNGTVFDSNVDPKYGNKEAFTFNLGAGEVIKGWDVGLVGMKIGEKRKLEIAPEFAYGPNAIGNVIPANSTLVFEVELTAVNK